VLVSSLTFAATANTVIYCGAEPVFIDTAPDSWCLDPGLVEEELKRCADSGRLPRALIAVDLYGDCCNYQALGTICARFDVPVIEDAAEALGSRSQGKSAGTLGAMGVLSFNGNKIITTSGGGMLLSDRADWIHNARFLATQARDPAPHYEHTHVGYNYRMSNLLAAVGRGQLRQLDSRVAARRAIYLRYQEAFADMPGISFLPPAAGCEANRWLTVVLVDPEMFGASREDLRVALERMNIEARPVWKPMHLQPVFAGARFVGPGRADDLFRKGLCLPSGSAMRTGDQERVVEIIRTTHGHTRKVCGGRRRKEE
jgi:dTDP-4-amino-4,6-dideoxygalactose transaminase